ncbi:hypothetical protein DFA_04794 [Cavenderia fasciculata]|uniref:Uncharacterized protein n=1 Tax=Cavenderia fasciculata TaxID=261658 RepID=F4PNY5_CACFS|nr:uncharacterized protein DFA_04794 [Cavenderia fasciculata]EGG22664.1 hypothetical protein DFA_04794 [Cavenderia fasciculata]|eukprot:XP_004360515.1 hypothetical protein DFA_04794 [Cavenderia fasciculata]
MTGEEQPTIEEYEETDAAQVANLKRKTTEKKDSSSSKSTASSTTTSTETKEKEEVKKQKVIDQELDEEEQDDAEEGDDQEEEDDDEDDDEEFEEGEDDSGEDIEEGDEEEGDVEGEDEDEDTEEDKAKYTQALLEKQTRYIYTNNSYDLMNKICFGKKARDVDGNKFHPSLVQMIKQSYSMLAGATGGGVTLSSLGGGRSRNSKQPAKRRFVTKE